MTALSDHDVAALAFEARWWRQAGAKDAAIRSDLGLTPTEHYRRLSLLIDTPAALEHAPVLVHRLRRLRDQRAQVRAARRLAS